MLLLATSKTMYLKKELIDRLAKGEFNPNLKGTIEAANQFKIAHRLTRRGYTKKKNLRHVVEVNKAIFYHPYFRERFFNPNMDEHEARKAMYEFARLYPQYAVVDKL